MAYHKRKMQMRTHHYVADGIFHILAAASHVIFDETRHVLNFGVCRQIFGVVG